MNTSLDTKDFSFGRERGHLEVSSALPLIGAISRGRFSVRFDTAGSKRARIESSTSAREQARVVSIASS